MPTSSVYIYDCGITPERNCIVEDILTYLSGKETVSLTDFQYIKIDINISIKIYKDETYVADRQLGNYVRILQDNNRSYYYFILSKKWISQGCVQLNLGLDTLNTYSSDISFDKKTLIYRQHKNRFYDNTTNLAANTSYTKSFVIDKTDEGLSNVATETSKTSVADTRSQLAGNWYLLYRAANSLAESENQIVTCELYPAATNLKASVAASSLTGSSLSASMVYYCVYNAQTSENNSVLVQGSYYIDGSILTSNHFPGIIFRQNSSNAAKIDYALISQTQNSDGIIDLTHITWVTVSSLYFSNAVATIRGVTASSYIVSNPGVIFGYGIQFTLSDSTTYIKNISQVDRTDSRIIKIIECPYCPIEATVSSYVVTLPTGWSYNSNIITCTNVSIELIRSSLATKIIYGTYAVFTTGSDVAKMSKSIALEPKLKHSAFSTYKLLYDSFTSEIKREQLSPSSNTSTPSITIAYKQSNTINSNLAFKWTPSNASYRKTGDYDDIMVCKRNNEVTIFSSDYLNYLRTGYNYDKKSLARSNLITGLNMATGVVGATASAASGNILSGVYSIGNIASGIKTIIENNATFEKKMQQLEMQSVAVSGSDDVNLLNYYCYNKLYICEYTPITELKNALWDLFYYCGYAVKRQNVPDTTSRYWFNYIQCDPVFTDATEQALTEEVIDDIRAKYKLGVTYYHVHNSEYDFDQQYENWEIGLIE